MVARSNVQMKSTVYTNSTLTSNCRVLNRLKNENNQKRNKAHRMSRSDMSVASNTGNSVASSCISVSSRNRRRNRQALQALSIEPFAGLSSSTKSTKPTKPPSSPKKWFKRRRHAKVAEDSSERENKNPMSILRNNKYHSLSGMEVRDPPPKNDTPTVRFAKGTIFQDPLQVERRKIPRTKDRLRKQRENTSIVYLVNTILPLFQCFWYRCMLGEEVITEYSLG